MAQIKETHSIFFELVSAGVTLEIYEKNGVIAPTCRHQEALEYAFEICTAWTDQSMLSLWA